MLFQESERFFASETERYGVSAMLFENDHAENQAIGSDGVFILEIIAPDKCPADSQICNALRVGIEIWSDERDVIQL